MYMPQQFAPKIMLRVLIFRCEKGINYGQNHVLYKKTCFGGGVLESWESLALISLTFGAYSRGNNSKIFGS